MSATSIETPAIVLRTVAYGEADRVVTLLGRTTGRVSALAKNARKSQRRFGGGLGLGTTGTATLRLRGGDLQLLETFEVTQGRLGLAGDLARTAHAAYVVELVEKTSAHGDVETNVFDLLAEMLDRLEGEAPSAVRLRVFELALLAALGLAPTLDACAVCGRADLADERTRYLPAQGGVVCESCARAGRVLTAGERRALATLARTSLAAAAASSLDSDVARGVRETLAMTLAEHVPGELKSVEFIRKVTDG